MDQPFDSRSAIDTELLVGEFGSLLTDPAGPASPADSGSKAPPSPDPSDHLAIGVQVLLDLLRVETRPNRVRRVLRIWESKVATAIRSRDLAAAESWMRGISGSDAIPPEHAAAVGASVAALSRPALIDDLLVWLVDSDSIEDASGLLSEWGDPIVGRMIDLMAVDDPPVNRRYMVDVLATIGRSESRLLVPHASDHRWFIVRNVAIALGRAGRLATIPVLRSLIGHEDARVRVEAIRGLAAVDSEATLGDVVAAFQDSDRRVRQAAVSLLRACPSPEVVTRLSEVVRLGKVNALEAERLVEVIGERRDDAARLALEDIANRRGRSRAPKAIRSAAKRQLARRAT
ncbi:MAG: HEAT repeat domain-containing protein [Acidimicrobiia bacterium]|nr:HEAT repeat domain-containing protein [Acidimicrobiia bacterium]